MEPWLAQIEAVAHKVALDNGCTLYDLEMVGGQSGRVLRVYIDKEETGVGIEDCSLVSKGLSEFLEQNEELIPGAEYELEVSSPGLDRQLKKLEHFQKVIGQKIFVQLKQSLGSLGAQEKALQLTKKFEENLKAIEDSTLVFSFKKEDVKVPFEMIEKSKVVIDYKQILKNAKK